MEGSSKSSSQQYHMRSISLPSRLNPTSIKVETELNKLKSSVSVGSLLIPNSIQNNLVALAELYNCIEELVHSPHNKQTFFRHKADNLVENALEASIGMLDLCSNLKDLLSLMKQSVHDLQSGLRRKGGDSSIRSHISAYFCSRKQAKKIIAKTLKSLKQMECKTQSTLPLDIDQNLSMVCRVLGEVSSITINVFRSLLLFLSVPCSRTKASRSSRWSLISNLMMKSSTSCEGKESENEAKSVEVALHSLQSRIDIEMAQKRLQILDAKIVSFESGLDCLFRRMVQSRASLLNILTN